MNSTLSDIKVLFKSKSDQAFIHAYWYEIYACMCGLNVLTAAPAGARTSSPTSKAEPALCVHSILHTSHPQCWSKEHFCIIVTDASKAQEAFYFPPAAGHLDKGQLYTTDGSWRIHELLEVLIQKFKDQIQFVLRVDHIQQPGKSRKAAEERKKKRRGYNNKTLKQNMANALIIAMILSSRRRL